MKNVLLPTDFSKNSRNAISYALDFFQKESCNFYLLHVDLYEEMVAGEYLYNTRGTAIENKNTAAHQELRRLREEIVESPTANQHQFFTCMEQLFFVDAVRKHIEKQQIDFIVMGTLGASGLKGKIIGSNTGDIITKVKCPVLVIPEEASFRGINEIAFPTDYHIFYKNRILQTLVDVLSEHHAVLRILHISRKEQELTDLQIKNKDFLENYLKPHHEHSFHFLSNPSIEEAVQCFVESREVDMITMIAKNLNFFQRILFHPTVEKISYHIKVPFLVLHE